MPSTVRTPPDPNLLAIHFLPGLRVGNGITDVVALHIRQDLVPRLPRFDVTLAEAAIVVNQAANWELGDEVFGEGVEVHFLERGEAMRHHQAGEFGRCGGGGVEPAAEGDFVGGLEGDVFTRHFWLGCNTSKWCWSCRWG